MTIGLAAVGRTMGLTAVGTVIGLAAVGGTTIELTTVGKKSGSLLVAR